MKEKLYKTSIKNHIQKKIGIDEWEQDLKGLQSKFLIYERKSLSNLSDRNYLYTIFSDIYKVIKNLDIIDQEYYKKIRFSSIFSKYIIPKDLRTFSDKTIYWRWNHF